MRPGRRQTTSVRGEHACEGLPEPGGGNAEVFEHLRPRLFGIAYRMLGSVHDAEDVLQTAYLRWHEAEPAIRC